MSLLSSSEAAKLLSGDDAENANDEPNREDIGDMSIRRGAMFGFDFLLLVGVRLSVVLGRVFLGNRRHQLRR